MFKAREIMIKDVIVVHQTTPLLEAMQILVEKKISGLPVVDKEEKLIGVITEKDLLRLLVSDVITSQEVVGDYMSLDVQCFSPQDNVIEICEFFIKTNVRRVPIVENGRVIGVISRRDIIRLILNSAR
ncbi:MAG: CBS domain-containing protein [Candidatus Omnitrophota bacterium]|jgi:CBS domain-containing protein